MLTFRNLLRWRSRSTRWTPRPDDEFVSFLPLRLDRRADDVALRVPRRRLHRELPRGAGDGAGEHARDRAARHVRAAADLGGHGLHGPGADHGHHPLQAPHVRAVHAGRLRGGRRAASRQAGRAAGRPAPRTGWRRLPALPGAQGPPRAVPAAQRLHRRRGARARTSSASSTPSACPEADLRPDRDRRGSPASTATATSASTRWASPSPAPRCASRSGRDPARGARRCSSATTRTRGRRAEALPDGWLHTGDAGLHRGRAPRRHRPAEGRDAPRRRDAASRPSSSRTSSSSRPT